MRPFMAPATPAESAHAVGTYLTDGKRLVQVLEGDEAAVLVEDARTEMWMELSRQSLAMHWRPVEPAPEP